MQRAPEVAAQPVAHAAAHVMPSDWSRNNRTWFAAVQTEKRMMFLVLALIVAVAAFNLLSSLVMAVKDKQSDIAILRTLGAGPREIARVFLVQGALIGVVGTIAGVLGALLIAYNVDVIVPFIERLLGVRFLPREVYFISALPSDPRSGDIVAIGLTSLVLSLLATLYPSAGAPRACNRPRCCAMTDDGFAAARRLKAEGLTKVYDEGPARIEVLSDVSLAVARGEMVAIVGASGSGKSTLLHILGLLDVPTAGSVSVDGMDAARLNESAESALRNRAWASCTSSTTCCPEFSALDNVAMPLIVRRQGRGAAREGRARCWRRWARPAREGHFPGNCRAASASAWPWPAPWSRGRPACWPTSPPATSTGRPRTTCSRCCLQVNRR